MFWYSIILSLFIPSKPSYYIITLYVVFNISYIITLHMIYFIIFLTYSSLHYRFVSLCCKPTNISLYFIVDCM